MANKDSVKKVFALVFFKFPSRKPTEASELQLAFDCWCRIYEPIPDAALLDAAGRFVARTTKVYPTDDPFAMILEFASPQFSETAGDVIELVDEAVSRFGMYRDVDAMAWIESKSKLCAAVIKRFGFKQYCHSENAEVARGQLKSMFEQEKAKSKAQGFVSTTALDMIDGADRKRLDQPQKISGVLEQVRNTSRIE